MSDPFYITLPSHSNKKEFPNNKANHYKIRLPQAIRLEGSGWQVGLSAISLPDAAINLGPFKELNNPLLRAKWLAIKERKSDGSYTTEGVETNLTFQDILHDNNIVDGLSFMRALIFKFAQIVNFKSPPGYLREFANGKTCSYEFKWESQDLVLDNTKLDTSFATSTPGVHYLMSLNEKLALQMGWVKYDQVNTEYRIGPNLKMEFTRAVKTYPNDISRGRLDVWSGRRYWAVENGALKSSIFCNWRFTNFNNAFQNVIGNEKRSLFVYSDVGGSSVVGDQVTDLLREINFSRTGKGAQYFEPLHIQYIPVRKETLDIIEVQVAETTGELVKFGGGNTVVTIHVKKP